jgi:NitT/TauT family transport system permease protein
LVKRFSYQLNMDDAFAVLIILMLLGLVLYAVTALMDSVVVFWNHDRRMNSRTLKRVRLDARRAE